MPNKEERRALVVGASRGLGLGLATELKSRGWVRIDMGGPGAPLCVEESVSGIADLIEARRGTLRHGFVDYRGRRLAWQASFPSRLLPPGTPARAAVRGSQ